MLILPSRDLLAQAPAKELDGYQLRLWTIESGLPQNTVNALVQAQEGYVWIGTPAGLARFDGVQFKIFSRRNTPALKNDRILALHEDGNKVLWIGTDGGGLCSYHNGVWKSYTTQDGLSNNHVRAIVSDWQGNLWAGTEYGLNRLSIDGLKVYTTQDGLYDDIITALALDIWGNLWIGTLRGGVARFKDNVMRVYSTKDGLQNMAVYSLSADNAGNIWIGTMEGLYILKQDEEIIRSVRGTAYTPVTSILKDDQGNIWAGTMADGLKRMIGNNLAAFSAADAFPDDFIRSLIIDRSGNIWIGTDTGGLIQLKEAKVRSVTKEKGLPENAVQAVLEDHEGIFWVGTRNSGLCRMRKDKVIEVIDKEKGLSSNRIRSLGEDSRGALWIGTEGGGVNRLEKRKVIRLTAEDGLPSDNITAILEDGAGAVWIGTDRGLKKLANGKIPKIDSQDFLAGRHIRVLRRSPQGILYAGTREGLFMLVDRDFKKIPVDDEPEMDVLSLDEDGDGVLWIGTNGNGLKRWFDGKMTSYTTETGLDDNYIFSLTEDNQGNLWMSTNSGILRVSRQELNDFSGKKLNSIFPARYDEADGLPSRQCAGECQPSCWRTGDNRLYYPTVKGLAIFDLKSISTPAGPPGVVIEDVLAGDESILGKQGIALSSKVKTLEFRFTAFDFTAPEKIRFRYKLEGRDNDFVDAAPPENREARYLGLKAGRYRFLITAANNDGLWNEQAASFEFTVLPPIYRKPLFYAALILIILTLSGSGLFIRYKKQLKKRRQKYKTSSLGPGKAEEIIPKLLCLMEEEKLFLDPDLTLRELSQRLRVHYNHLSRIINERFGLSYNDFINRYRIEEAKRKMAAPEEKESTILDILLSSGFYSKSVFNTAFKKFTGMTPSEYRKRHL